MDFTRTTAPFSQLSSAINFGVEGLVSEKLAPGRVFVSRSLYHINPTSSAAFNQSYITPAAHIMIFLNSSETEMETIRQRELKSASGLDFL